MAGSGMSAVDLVGLVMVAGRMRGEAWPHAGAPGIRHEVTQNALQMADLPTLTGISKIVDEDLWFFQKKGKFEYKQN